MKRFLVLFSAFLLVFGFAGSALAIPVTFDYTGGSGTRVNNATFTGSDGLTTVFADEFPSDRDLYLGSNGLGVYGPDSADSGSGTQLDGYGTDEAIIFTFSDVIHLTSVSFGGVGSNDGFGMSVWDGVQFNSIFNVFDIPDSDTYTFIGTYISNIFRIEANVGNDDFYVSGMQVDVNTPTPTPEPATMLLLGTGLLALAGAGRKKFFKK